MKAWLMGREGQVGCGEPGGTAAGGAEQVVQAQEQVWEGEAFSNGEFEDFLGIAGQGEGWSTT